MKLGWLRSRKFWITVFVTVPIVIFATTAWMFHYSTTPSFCNSCHIMEPYYEAWATSKHNKVSCVQCHYPPTTNKLDYLWLKFQALSQVVKYVTRTYSSKPYAEIPDESCLRSGCHETRLLEGKIQFKRGIMFDHRAHLTDLRRGKKLRCTSCHSQIVIGNHMEVTESTCFICHFKDRYDGRDLRPLAGCPSCHLPPEQDFKLGGITYNHKDFIARKVPCTNCHLEVVQGEGEAPRERCTACHNRVETFDKYENVAKLHDIHITQHGVQCTHCHLEIRHQATTPKPMQENCAICHTSKHVGQAEMYAGIAGRGVSEAMPSPMFAAQVDCIGCHQVPTNGTRHVEFDGQTFVASEAGCVKCHGKAYAGMLDRWKSVVRAALEAIEPKLKDAEKESKGDAGARGLVSDARYNFNFVRDAKGVHNIYYASRLLEVADQRLDSAYARLKKTSPINLTQEPLLSGGYCLKLCHTQLGVNLSIPEVTQLGGRTMPHRRHWSEFGLGCKNCHQIGKHKEISLKITSESCDGCHHAAAEGKCTTCHTLQDKFYRGTLDLNVVLEKKPANAMAGTVDDCTGCHDGEHPEDRKAIVAKCAECHEEPEYKTMIEAWRSKLRGWDADYGKVLAEVERKVSTWKKAEAAAAKARMEAVQKDVTLVRGVNGAHNLDLAEKIYQAAKAELLKIGQSADQR